MREPGSNVVGMRALSNTALVEQAARKALSAQQLDKTIERVRQLCVTPGEDVTELEETAETLRNAGFRQELMRLLSEALSLPEANPHVGAMWMRRVVLSKVWDHRYPTSMDSLCERGEIGHRAVIEFLELVGAKRRHQLVRQATRRHAKWLRTHPQGWSAAGRALVQARCYSQAVRWMADWRSQPALDLATLYNLTLALRATGRAEEAQELMRIALSKPGGGEQFPIFKLWLAQDEVFAGNVQNASALFKAVDPTGWDDDALAVFYLVRSVLRVQKAQESKRAEAFSSARDRLSDIFRRVPIYKRDVFLRREYRRCFTRMARDAGEWAQSVRAVWRSAESWGFIVPLLLIPGLQLFLPCYLYRLCARRRGLPKRR